jgi:hypothetical protein
LFIFVFLHRPNLHNRIVLPSFIDIVFHDRLPEGLGFRRQINLAFVLLGTLLVLFVFNTFFTFFLSSVLLILMLQIVIQILHRIMEITVFAPGRLAYVRFIVAAL